MSAGAKEHVPDAIDYLLLVGAQILLKLGSWVTLVMISLLDVTIKLLSYNGFTESPVVSAGWSITRDTVNMFFVVVLIVIALGTIFGYHKFQWQSQVPRLMLFALVINFSKTICGILIDVGQVIMLTFANALQAVAAGNFIQLFALNQQTFSQCNDPTGFSCQLGSFELFAGSAAALLASLWVLVTVLILVAVFAWRIVMLWVLIAIAPLTWFVGGAHGIIQSHAYEDWWKKFTCAVSVGPILTFFLWLTLSVAGSGSLAASKGLDSFSQSEKVATSIPITLFEPVHLMTFVIAMAMIYAGFEAASSFCGGASGFVGGLISKGQGAGKAMAFAGAGVAAGAAAKGGRLGLRGAKWTGKTVGGELAPKLAKMPVVRAVTSKGREDIWREKQKGAGSGVIGRGISKFAGAQADQLEAERKEKAKETLKGVEGLSSTSKSQMAKRLAAMGGLPKTEAGTKEAAALWAAIKADKDAMKEMNEDELVTLQNRFGEKAKELAKGNKDLTDKQVDWEIENLDISGNFDALKPENVSKIGKRALSKLASDPKLIGKLEGMSTDKYDKESGVALNALEAFQKGIYGKDKQAAFTPEAQQRYYDGLDEKGLAKASTAALATNLSDAKIAANPSVAQRILKDPEIALKMRDGNAARFAAVAKAAASDGKGLGEVASHLADRRKAASVGERAKMDGHIDAVRSIMRDNGQGTMLAGFEKQLKASGWNSAAPASVEFGADEARLNALVAEDEALSRELSDLQSQADAANDAMQVISPAEAQMAREKVARLEQARSEKNARRNLLNRQLDDIRESLRIERNARAAAAAEERSRRGGAPPTGTA